MLSVLVTGAAGFIGRLLCSRLQSEGWKVTGTGRMAVSAPSLISGVGWTVVDQLGPDTQWDQAVAGIDVVFHLAARVHIMNDPSADPLAEFRRVNVAGTERLASEASKAGVKRFVFISSIKVNGEETSEPYTPDSAPHPSDPYGISKWEAEQALRRIEAATGMQVVVVRLPLVYGPGVKANFLNLIKTVEKGIPLPFARVDNKRSFLYAGNLVDALAVCAAHPAAAGKKTYLVSDNDDVSTPELIRRVAHALGKQPKLFPLSPHLIRLAGTITGKGAAVRRLIGSLMVDSSLIRNELGWKPLFTMEQGLRETAEWFSGKR